jgi:hypothetical protein
MLMLEVGVKVDVGVGGGFGVAVGKPVLLPCLHFAQSLSNVVSSPLFRSTFRKVCSSVSSVAQVGSETSSFR